MRITLVISSLGMGGAERNATLLAGGLAGRGHSVRILTLEPRDARPAFPLTPEVAVERLDLLAPSAGLAQALAANVRRMRALRRAIRTQAPHVVLAFMEQTAALCVLACLGTGLPVVCCERTNPALHAPGRFWSLLRRLSYPLAGAVAFQTAHAAAALPWTGGRAAVIPNPVPAPAPESAVPSVPDLPRPFAVCLGRLSPEKQYDLFLRAFARAAERHPDWGVVLVGDGPERQALEQLAAELGLGRRAVFTGALPEPSGVLRQAALFVLSSRFEGFPTALCEALACGVPAVAFDCPSGPAEIIRDGVDGLLVPSGDVEALAQAMSRLMADAELRSSMARRAPEVLERFGLEKVLNMWEALLLDISEHYSERAAGGERA